ncbi:hypothetical protein FD754_024861, partial [Muntiacus muntjak]
MKVLFSLTSICLLINQSMDIEVTILNEVSQTEEKQIPYDATYVWNLKYDTKDLIQNRLVDIKSKLMGELWFLHRVRIRNVQVPEIKFEATSDNSTNVTIPITADVTVNLPLLGDIVDLVLKVDLQISVSIETDAETGDSKVVVGECTNNNPESISLTVLHRRDLIITDCPRTPPKPKISSAAYHQLERPKVQMCSTIFTLLPLLPLDC